MKNEKLTMLKRNISITILFLIRNFFFIKIIAKDNNEICLTNILNDSLIR